MWSFVTSTCRPLPLSVSECSHSFPVSRSSFVSVVGSTQLCLHRIARNNQSLIVTSYPHVAVTLLVSVMISDFLGIYPLSQSSIQNRSLIHSQFPKGCFLFLFSDMTAMLVIFSVCTIIQSLPAKSWALEKWPVCWGEFSLDLIWIDLELNSHT